MSMDDSANRNVEQSFDEDERPTTSSSNKMGMGMKETVIPQAGLDEETDDDFNFGHRRSRYKSGGSNSSDSPVPSPNARTRQLELQRRRRSSFSTSQTHASFSGPAAYATLASVPIVNPKTNKPMRNYQLHPSRNKFLFGGRLLLGGDSPWAFIFCFTIVLAISGLWFGATCPWWWRNEGAGGKVLVIIGAYLAAMVITSMLTTATMDPGILPRNLDPDPPYPANSPSDGGVRAPMPRDLKVRSDVVRVKYCPTCKTYRPPRSSHCKMCDNCIDGCDHHCQWVNNCVGRRNYTTFFVLLLSATLALILIICTTALHLYLLTRRENMSFRQAIARGEGAGSAAAFALSIVVIWPVSALTSYHVRLLLLNITTIEQIRNQAHKTLVPGPAPPNPFSHGTWRRNLMAVLCRPSGYSWLDPSGIATEDKREVNPGLADVVHGRDS
ncbi:isoform h [Moniliophthora roreri MCA 2997]|uniref:Palmitoyltransferase n=1 Tax=Moniliophthora roreri (strain MCA 2997) TaxID=1381753 RepID=V2XAK8_MONRO|nr:isoform h [Moniliophthora roreri MCA 2997]